MEELQTLINNNGDIFIGELNDEVYYLSRNNVRFECSHYFSSISLTNSNNLIHIDSFNLDELQQFNTILSLNDLLSLQQLNTMINNLGYGIDPDSEEYQQGLILQTAYKNIVDKLLNDSNVDLLVYIINQHTEILYQDYKNIQLPIYDCRTALLNSPNGYIGYKEIERVYQCLECVALDYMNNSLSMELPLIVLDNLDLEELGRDIVSQHYGYYILDNDYIVKYY